MRSRKLTLALVGVLVALASVAGGGVAQAAFPDFSGCTATDESESRCVHISQRTANFNIKGFNIPLREDLTIRGMITVNPSTGAVTFVPPAGTNGFFARAVRVPGGVFGIEWLPGNTVLAITELAGPASAIRFDLSNLSMRLPIKVRLVNILLGMDCRIGTNSNPVNLNLTRGTTSPPPPNTPITGTEGTASLLPNGKGLAITGNVHVDNAFAVPGATECGLGLGLINSLVNSRLRLPSAAGNNSMSIVNDVAIGLP